MCVISTYCLVSPPRHQPSLPVSPLPLHTPFKGLPVVIPIRDDFKCKSDCLKLQLVFFHPLIWSTACRGRRGHVSQSLDNRPIFWAQRPRWWMMSNAPTSAQQLEKYLMVTASMCQHQHQAPSVYEEYKNEARLRLVWSVQMHRKHWVLCTLKDDEAFFFPFCVSFSLFFSGVGLRVRDEQRWQDKSASAHTLVLCG